LGGAPISVCVFFDDGYAPKADLKIGAANRCGRRTLSTVNTAGLMAMQRSYRPVGHCIYCGATDDLEREHILPFGLSGVAVLPKATCRRCAKITGKTEQTVLRGPMWPVRVYRGLRSRTKHKNAPKTYPLTIVKNGKEETVQLQAEEYPILLHFPLFSPPGLLSPEGYTSGIRLTGVATISFGPNPVQVAKTLRATEFRDTQSHQPAEFARMVAKIAYAFAVAEDQLERIEGEPLVIPAILGETDNIGNLVGTLTEPFTAYPGELHRILVVADEEKGLLISEVHLFSDSQAPRYGIILGHLRKKPNKTDESVQ
jgi:hypothetical protein